MCLFNLSAADDDHVKVVCCGSSSPARSRTTYSVAIARLIRELRPEFAKQQAHCLLARSSYFASIQVSDPVSFTDTSEIKMCRGLPSAVPRCSVEMSRGPAFL